MTKKRSKIGVRGQRVDPIPCGKCGGMMTSYESRKIGYHKHCEPKAVA